jgi:hypothetical protein
MNRLGLNILLVLLLSGCSVFNKNSRTDSKGETINKNAPVFISPKTNAIPVNKPNTNEVAVNKPPQVIFNADNYVMVKEKDLNLIVDQKTNEILLNIKKSNANQPQPNKELDAAIDEHIQRKKSGDSETGSLTPNVVQLAPVVEPEKPSNSASIHPLFAFILVVLSLSAFILTVGYFLFIKKRAAHEAPTTTPTTPKVATETAAKDSLNKDTEAPKD